MGIESLCSAVANAVRQEVDQEHVKHGKISSSMVQVAGRFYPYTVVVDIAISDGDWAYVAIVNNRAVVVGK